MTGIKDHHLIQKAIAECSDQKGKYQIDDVVNRLLGYDVTPSSPSLVNEPFRVYIILVSQLVKLKLEEIFPQNWKVYFLLFFFHYCHEQSGAIMS